MSEIERAALEDLFVGLSMDTLLDRVLLQIKKLLNIH
jgi:hypothetical protein